jgi:cell division control protein 24
MLRTPRKASSANSTLRSPSGAEPPATTPTNNINALNKTVNNSTGIYQQCIYLRSRLHRLPLFAQFLEFSHSGPRATKDVVSQLWETLSLGRPLCVLFNLQHIPTHVKIAEYADAGLDPDPLRKERQRAVALFVMGVNALKGMGLWEKDAPIFSIGELVGDTMNTNGFVKVVATVIYLLDKLPATVWSDEVQQISESILRSHEHPSSVASREDMERANIVRELIETERKYCQDLETMQVSFDSTKYVSGYSFLAKSPMPSRFDKVVLKTRTPFIVFSLHSASLPTFRESY